ncbi:hypothetical protein J2Z50_003989 [Ensifer mexicanus]|nr:hypothetical protein [Sinorhizobium mexicanum]
MGAGLFNPAPLYYATVMARENLMILRERQSITGNFLQVDRGSVWEPISMPHLARTGR